MNRSGIFILVTVLAVVASVVIVVGKQIPADELQLLLTKGVVPATLIGPGKKAHRAPRAASPATGEASKDAEPVVRTDEELAAVLAALPILQEIPWQPSDIASLFSRQDSRPCRLLPPDVPVDPALTTGLPQEGEQISQRSTAFLVGLSMDAKARAKMPSVSKATIENYLAQHLLAIQPEICQTRNGDFLFTGNVSAAFFSKLRYSSTEEPEPMIRDAVQSFRVLGVLPPTASGDQKIPMPRTLVMAFKYTRDAQDAATQLNGPRDEYELIFVHLLPQVQDERLLTPSLAVFTTTNGCKEFQELNIASNSLGRNEPTVMASIRFQNYKLMGVYPADPIVTGLSNKIRGSLSVEQLRNRLEGRAGERATSLESVLDQLHLRPEVANLSAKP
ncbi:hypothetical protein SH661x_003019 [Planctomicrobium sp. SH661]|uniref:hypothetical protein n=1 Tax=Planctomicrobium sp. SH661 TaxID=3448124 RepID=UPI003F5BF088